MAGNPKKGWKAFAHTNLAYLLVKIQKIDFDWLK